MLTLTIINLFIIIAIIKFCTLYVDINFFYSLCGLIIILYYLHTNKVIIINAKIFENVNKDEQFENIKNDLKKITNDSEFFSHNKILQKQLIKKLEEFIEDITEIYYFKNTNQNCKYQIDVLIDRYYDILNLGRSFIITYKRKIKYNEEDNVMQEFNKKLFYLLNFIIEKCPKYSLNKIKTANLYEKSNNSFQQL